MDTYLKLTSVKNDSNCNCIKPFYINNITGINPITQRDYSSEDLDAMKTSLYRISTAKGCGVSVCCDVNDPNTILDSEFTKQFIKKFPKLMPLYEGTNITGFKLSTIEDVKETGWQVPTPYMICKITKATITDSKDPTIKLVSNLVKDCYSNNCSSLETITVNTLLQNSKADMNYTYFDDARVSQAILENNISYVKEYIKKYKQINIPLTNNDYNNRLIHLAAGSNYTEILTMLIALKANLNITNKLLETPIHFAVRSKNIENINSILVQGVDLNLANNTGETAMFYAMKTGDIRIINMLYNNNSPIHGVDKHGNNLISFCILNCPSYKEDDETIPNTKGEIIQFLIEHGISTEQKNNAGYSPLEMVSKQINKEIVTETALINKADSDAVVEAFFTNNNSNNRNSNSNSNIRNSNNNNNNRNSNNNSNSNRNSNNNSNSNLNNSNSNNSNRNNSNNNSNSNSNNTNNSNMSMVKPTKALLNKQQKNSVVTEQELTDYTTEHISLLDIQTKLFNNILLNNPAKYSKYISVNDIPVGSPIEVLDTVCVSSGETNSKTQSNILTGNEDSDECIAKGGQLVKIKNKTTKIKLELIPEEESKIELIKQEDLYYPKYNKQIPKGTIPNNIAIYNAGIKQNTNNSNILTDDNKPTSITYTVGQESNNTIPSVQAETKSNFNSTSKKPSNTQLNNVETHKNTEHPSIIEEDSEIVHKGKIDAFDNVEKITRDNGNFFNSKEQSVSSSVISINNNKSYLLLLLLVMFIIVYIYLY